MSEPTKKKITNAALWRMRTADVYAFWPLLVEAVQASVPATKDPTLLANIMGNISLGILQPWLIYIQTDESPRHKIAGITVTKTYTEDVSGVKTLNIYALYALVFIPMEAWEMLHGKLEAIARREHCHRIEAFVGNPRSAKIVEKLGYTSQSYVFKEL